MSGSASKHLFTTRDFHRMADAGVFSPDERVELLAGEVVQMTPIGPLHAWCVTRLQRRLERSAGNEIIVRIQNPVVLGEHWEPQPDIAVARARPGEYREAHPTPADILLLVEVAESSAGDDRRMKIPAYAFARIPEAWLVDLERALVHIFRDPSPEGYRTHQTLSGSDRLTTPSVPAFSTTVAEIVS